MDERPGPLRADAPAPAAPAAVAPRAAAGAAPPAAGAARVLDGDRMELRPEDFKVLASDSRVQILKRLDQRPMTGTELGKDLGLEKSTVHGHLEKLVEAGLVQRQEDDRLWVYYRLSPRGRRLLHPPRAGFTLLLSGSLLSAGAALTLGATWILGNAVRAPMEEGRDDAASAPSVEPEAGKARDADADTAGGAPEGSFEGSADAASDGAGVPLLPVLAAGLFALAAALGAAAWWTRPK